MNSYNVNNINDNILKNWLLSTMEGYNDPLCKSRFLFVSNYIQTNFPKEKGFHKILDVGCGNGIYVKKLKKDGYTTTGIDSDDVIKAIPDREEFNLIAADAENLPFEDNSFDLILCFEVLEHIANYDKAMQEIRRCLKKDGVFLAELPNLFCYDSIEGSLKIVSSTITFVNKIRNAFGLKYIYEGGYSAHIYKYFPHKWRKELLKNGFQTIEDFPLFVSPYVPGKIKILKKLEEWTYSFEKMINFQSFLSKLLRNIPVLRYTGQVHLFVCKNK